MKKERNTSDLGRVLGTRGWQHQVGAHEPTSKEVSKQPPAKIAAGPGSDCRGPQVLAKHPGTPGEPGETASNEARRKKTSGEDRGRPEKRS